MLKSTLLDSVCFVLLFQNRGWFKILSNVHGQGGKRIPCRTRKVKSQRYKQVKLNQNAMGTNWNLHTSSARKHCYCWKEKRIGKYHMTIYLTMALYVKPNFSVPRRQKDTFDILILKIQPKNAYTSLDKRKHESSWFFCTSFLFFPIWYINFFCLIYIWDGFLFYIE